MATRPPNELVLRAQKGDAAAFSELFRKHRSSVAAIAYRMMGPGADLEDMVQEVFLQVHRSLPDFRGQSKFSTWLHRVAVNVVLMARRRARSRPTYTHEDAGRHESDDALLPDAKVVRARRVDAFRRLLDRLSDKKRAVFILHELEGMAPAEIAKVVDCPVLTVRTRLFYARKELANMMRSEPSLSNVLETSGADKRVSQRSASQSSASRARRTGPAATPRTPSKTSDTQPAPSEKS